MIDNNGHLIDYTDMPTGRLRLGVNVATCPKCGKNGKLLNRKARSAGGDEVNTYVHIERVYPNGLPVTIDFHSVPVADLEHGVQPTLY